MLLFHVKASTKSYPLTFDLLTDASSMNPLNPIDLAIDLTINKNDPIP